uniref:Uncharacterized protein n=1 Tax=Romanomermis culicivorax TaxID=13658 RepID=A0A915J044_ROMCU
MNQPKNQTTNESRNQPIANKSRHSLQSKEYRSQESEDYQYFKRPFPNDAAYNTSSNNGTQRTYLEGRVLKP